METLPLRLRPGTDLRRALESAVAARGCEAAFVISGIGSLRGARLRMAGASASTTLEGNLEILTLAGSIAPDASHLHMSVADHEGRVFGGHVAYGCAIRTTAEVLVALLSDWTFTHEHDPETGYAELTIRRKP